MRTLISLALVLLAAAMLTAWASASTGRKHVKHTSTSTSSIAAIADASTSWAEFTAKVPNLQEALARDSQPPLR